jgi:hypothetical protein
MALTRARSGSATLSSFAAASAALSAAFCRIVLARPGRVVDRDADEAEQHGRAQADDERHVSGGVRRKPAEPGGQASASRASWVTPE